MAAPPRSLHRPATTPTWTGEIAFIPILDDASPGSDDPPFDGPPRAPRTGDDGGGGGGKDEPRPGASLPAAAWIVIAAVALAVPAGFLAAACIHRGV